MAYSRFWDSDIYIYPHVEGHICCAACWLSEEAKSEIIEDRSYFENGKLLHQLNNQDCGSPFKNDYLLEEQKRIKTDYEKLLKLETTK